MFKKITGPTQDYKLLHHKENHKQNEKEIYRLGENICKWCNQQELNFQNIQNDHTIIKSNQINNTIKRRGGAEDLNRPQRFLQRRHKTANRPVKRCSRLLEKCKSKLHWGITSHQSGWLPLKSLWIINAGEGVEKRGLSYSVDGNVDWCSHRGKQYGVSLKTKNRVTIWPSNPTPGHISW